MQAYVCTFHIVDCRELARLAHRRRRRCGVSAGKRNKKNNKNRFIIKGKKKKKSEKMHGERQIITSDILLFFVCA